MNDLRIHSFARLARTTESMTAQKISDDELAMLSAAGNVNNLISGGFPLAENDTSTNKPTDFSAEGAQTPKDKQTSKIGTQILGLVERGKGE